MADTPLLADTLRQILTRLDTLEKLLRVATPPRPANPPTRETPAKPGRGEDPEAILASCVERIALYWETHRQPMHFYKFAGAFAKRWNRQARDARVLLDALTRDPRLGSVLTEAGGTVFVPRDVYDAASPVDRLEWSKSTKSSIRDAGQSQLDAAASITREESRLAAGHDATATNPLAGSDPFGETP